jgi:hypothetical protein
MKRINRSLITATIAGGLCCGIGAVQANWSGHSPAVNRLDDDHHKFPHMHHALDKLKDARHELEQTEDIFRGHKDEAIGHVDDAIAEIHAGLKEHDDDSAISADLPAARKLDDQRFPHMHAALDRLREGRDELKAAEDIFAGHRDKAVEHTDKAIKQLEDGIHDAER